MTTKKEKNGLRGLGLEKKLALYGLAGSALLALPAAAQATIVYSGILNETSVTTIGDVGDVITFGLTGSTLELGWGGDATDDLDPSMVTLLSWTTANAYVAGDNTSGFASVFSTGSVIDDTTDWMSTSVPVLTKTSGSDHTGNWSTDGTAAYAGLSFTSSGSTYYGWAQIGVAADSDSVDITLVDWAYESEAGVSILAGNTVGTPSAVPEPTTLSLFALGAVGLGMLRRGRKQDSAEE